jgi:hypothetical protein
MSLMATNNKYKVGDLVIWCGDRTDKGIIVEIDNNDDEGHYEEYKIYWFKFKRCHVGTGYSFERGSVSLLKEIPNDN